MFWAQPIFYCSSLYQGLHPFIQTPLLSDPNSTPLKVEQIQF